MLQLGFPVLFFVTAGVRDFGHQQLNSGCKRLPPRLSTGASLAGMPNAAFGIQKRHSTALQQSHPDTLAFKALFRA